MFLKQQTKSKNRRAKQQAGHPNPHFPQQGILLDALFEAVISPIVHRVKLFVLFSAHDYLVFRLATHLKESDLV